MLPGVIPSRIDSLVAYMYVWMCLRSRKTYFRAAYYPSINDVLNSWSYGLCNSPQARARDSKEDYLSLGSTTCFLPPPLHVAGVVLAGCLSYGHCSQVFLPGLHHNSSVTLQVN